MYPGLVALPNIDYDCSFPLAGCLYIRGVLVHKSTTVQKAH